MAFLFVWIYRSNNHTPLPPSPSAFSFPAFDYAVHFVNPPIPGLYRMKEYGVEFNYPKEYLISPYPVSHPAMVGITADDTPEHQWLFEMSVDISLPGYDPNDPTSLKPWPSTNTFKDVAEFAAKQRCRADGDYGSVSCDNVVTIAPFSTASGIPGYELYLHEVTKDWHEATVAERIRGPIFILDTKEATHGRLVDMRWELADFAYTHDTERYTKILREMVSSLRTFEN